MFSTDSVDVNLTTSKLFRIQSIEMVFWKPWFLDWVLLKYVSSCIRGETCWCSGDGVHKRWQALPSRGDLCSGPHCIPRLLQRRSPNVAFQRHSCIWLSEVEKHFARNNFLLGIFFLRLGSKSVPKWLTIHCSISYKLCQDSEFVPAILFGDFIIFGDFIWSQSISVTIENQSCAIVNAGN